MKYIKNGKLVLDGTIRECDLEEKCLRALELIDENNIDIRVLKDSPCVETYNDYAYWEVGLKEISAETFKLLKEILC